VLAVAFALVAASSWGLSAVLVRMGLRYTATRLGTLVSLVSGLIFTLLLVVALQPRELIEVSGSAVLLFALIGVLNFPAGRFFNYMSMERLGVGRSTPILASAPLFAVIIAVVFSGEELRLATVVGIALILAGLYVTLSAPSRLEPAREEQAFAQGSTLVAVRTQQQRRRVLAGVAFGFSASLAYGASQVLTRHTVSELAPPLVGSSIALFWGTLGFFLLSVRSLGQRGEAFRRGALLFAGAGIFSAVGVILMFQALSRGQVVVISPVLATNPLFTLVMAALMLRDVERITTRVVVGALLVVSGVAALSLL
jgi:DME family drug/metabolite transporter